MLIVVTTMHVKRFFFWQHLYSLYERKSQEFWVVRGNNLAGPFTGMRFKGRMSQIYC